MLRAAGARGPRRDAARCVGRGGGAERRGAEQLRAGAGRRAAAPAARAARFDAPPAGGGAHPNPMPKPKPKPNPNPNPNSDPNRNPNADQVAAGYLSLLVSCAPSPPTLTLTLTLTRTRTLTLTPTLTLTLTLTLSPTLTLHQAIPAALHRVPAPPKAASRLSMPFFARAHPGALRPLSTAPPCHPRGADPSPTRPHSDPSPSPNQHPNQGRSSAQPAGRPASASTLSWSSSSAGARGDPRLRIVTYRTTEVTKRESVFHGFCE